MSNSRYTPLQAITTVVITNITQKKVFTSSTCTIENGPLYTLFAMFNFDNHPCCSTCMEHYLFVNFSLIMKYTTFDMSDNELLTIVDASGLGDNLRSHCDC